MKHLEPNDLKGVNSVLIAMEIIDDNLIKSTKSKMSEISQYWFDSPVYELDGNVAR
jgi:hypothetical protein